jgi:hypothetical protein
MENHYRRKARNPIYCSALSVFFTLCASTINSGRCAVRSWLGELSW